MIFFKVPDNKQYIDRFGLVPSALFYTGRMVNHKIIFELFNYWKLIKENYRKWKVKKKKIVYIKQQQNLYSV